jgi:hypothetical protein
MLLKKCVRVVALLYIIMLSVNFFCNISSYDILAYITKNYVALISTCDVNLLSKLSIIFKEWRFIVLFVL